MAQQPQSIAQIYKKFTNTFSATENARDVVRFAKRRLSVDLKYGDVKTFLNHKNHLRVCEPFDSDIGQDWYYATIQHTSNYQKWLIDCYFKQKHHTTCALVSIAIVLNAKLLSNYYLSKYDTEDAETENENENENKFEFDSDNEEDIDSLKTKLPFLSETQMIDIFPNYSSRLTIDKVLVSGMSLDELGQVLLDFECKSVEIHQCNHDISAENGIQIFRQLCVDIFSTHNMDIGKAIICNFDLWELDTGIEGGIYGHMSPIAAYHSDSDRVLLLDTFTDESWVKIDSLYKAMNTKQGNDGKYRGYIVIESPPIWGQKKENNCEVSEEGYNDTNKLLDIYENSAENETVINVNKRQRRNNHSSIDFDFIVFDETNTKQNYNNTPTKRKSRRNSRRMSKKLQLYLEFDSENGQNLWKETQSTSLHQKWCVIEYFQQNRGTMYGLVTFAIIFNAKTMAYYHNKEFSENEYKDFEDNNEKLSEDKMVEMYSKYFSENDGNLKIPTIESVINNGMSLHECGNILSLFGCKSVQIMHTYEIELSNFRDLIKQTLLSEIDSVILINYDLLKLGTGIANGSISVIAAYNIKNDMVLLLNTNWIIGKCWVQMQLLYDAMNTIDDNTGKYRGCIVANGLPLID